MTHEPTLLPFNEYRYEMQLRHLACLAKCPGWYEYATKRSRELAEKEPSLYGKLPKDLWAILKEKKSLA